ncbi:MAG: AmmeMemoRadiSam system protein B [Planctomycetota bacterium]
MSDQKPNQPPPFDPAAEHQARPRLRKLRGFPLQAQGPQGQQVQLLGLADAQQISERVVATQPAFQVVLPLMDGSRDLDQIVGEVGRGLQREMLEQFVAQLDDAGLIQGPSFEAMLVKHRENFDNAETLPPGSTAQFADMLVAQQYGSDATDEQKAEHGPRMLKERLDFWIDEALRDAADPSLDALPKAIIAPHLDYARGWRNYAHTYGRLRVVDRPNRIVILGTNHFGQATGVCACDKGYESPLGTSPVAGDLLEAIKGKLGDDGAAKLLEHRYDHENEHSIELHLPWIQHVFGEGETFPPVLGVLVHDPAVNNGASYDDNGLGLEAFVDALKGAIADLPGKTLVVSSADLSHVGQAFGDQAKLNEQSEAATELREKTESHDKEMLAHIEKGAAQDLVGAMAWQQNPTRWCSVGNLVAMMQTVDAQEVRLLNYHAATDEQGMALVTSVAGVVPA